MTFVPDSRALICLAGTLLLALLAGCGPAEVVVQGNFPPPTMEKLPLTIGVWYDPGFANHEFFDEAKSKKESSWLVKSGEAQVQMWDTVLNGMFARVVPMTGQPGPGQMNPSVDAVLIPQIAELQYAIPAHTNVKVYEIWIRYHLQLVTTGGDPIADWTMPAYGKTPTAFLQSDQAAVNLAAVMALRDAGANFATTFARVPAVQAWLQQTLGTGQEASL
ncbi:MAG: hypothetical protein V2I26_17310 [Halieaceae bacterium]|jgi:hypothetical protein|nr:hypothetical protein [Halieaceae bacterium]